jgi:mRNA interferase RelE/StbE
MYEVILNKDAIRTMDKMPPKARERAFKLLERLRKYPRRGKRLHGELEGLLALRLGLWRIIYEIDSKQQLIIIHAIGPRGDIYK